MMMCSFDVWSWSPFSGGARVGPEAFELVLDRFETNELSDLRLDPPYDPHVGYVPYSPNSVEVVFSELRQ
jgi:hypothetical protein